MESQTVMDARVRPPEGSPEETVALRELLDVLRQMQELLDKQVQTLCEIKFFTKEIRRSLL